MAFDVFDPAPAEPLLVKLVVLGESGAGVSSFLGSFCDFPPVVNAEAALSPLRSIS
ncbi:hypothetical protein [Actinorugispora endophytica]|uniref:Uncharacterized protein n=1 Tax=Actinorugispora endophytica TaxID=1605990 RepID=A0A4R6V7A4_9ACTN|nr:hypothetical protein [Actinorugispora endophytica]TDQ54407.1 hypothetical protein EV190_102241 [Actinorugispora endophytica]